MKIKFLFFIFLMFSTSLIFSQVLEKQGAGVTIIVHGWNPDNAQPTWMQEMADAIITRSGNNGHVATITVTGTEGNLSASVSDWNFDLINANNAEIVILVNWTAVSNHLTTGITAQEVAATVAPIIYQSQNSQQILATLPLHLIGHSRGGGMVFEIARLLGLQGIDIDQVTALDPHPLTTADPQGVNPPLGPGQTIDAPISVYENILFTDVYYQNIEYPTGQYVTGAFNRLWTSLPGGYHNESGYTYSILGTNYDFSDHLNIILMYHGTIDLATPVTNGEATMTQTERNAWFNTYETQGEIEGFYYSHNIWGDKKSTDNPVSGGDQIIDGYHNNILLGGNGTRTSINWASASWLSILEVESSINTNVFSVGHNNIQAGDVISTDFTYRNVPYNNGIVNVSFDNDRNPYNAYISEISSSNAPENGSTISSGNVNITIPNTFTVGDKFYLKFEITDGSTQRFMYAPYELEFTNSTTTPTAGTLTFATTDLGTLTRTATNNVYELGEITSSDNLTSLIIEVIDDNINTSNINVMYNGNVQGQMIYTGSNNIWQFNPTAPFNWSVGINTLTTQFVDNDSNLLDIIVNFTYKQMYDVTFNVENSNGSLSATDGTSTLTSPATLEIDSNITFTATPDANYEVKEWKINNATVSNNASTELVIDNLAENTNVTVEFELITSIENINVNDYSIYPNPTSGIINFKFTEDSVQQIAISDITGKIIIKKTNINQNENIDLSNFTAGIYIAKIQINNDVLTTKIIKK